MSLTDDFRCMCGEPLVLEWASCPPATRYDAPEFRRWPGGQGPGEVFTHCPECGADLEEVLMEQIEREERDYGEAWARMVGCGGVRLGEA